MFSSALQGGRGRLGDLFSHRFVVWLSLNAAGLQLLSPTVPPPLVLMLPETMVAEEQRQRLVEAHAQVGHDERVGGQAHRGEGYAPHCAV